jgi:hypothetical protein
MSTQPEVHIGHLAWAGSRGPTGGDYVIAVGNNPRQEERFDLLTRASLGQAEGATVILVVLPGRFHPNAGLIADRVQAVVQNVVPDE